MSSERLRVSLLEVALEIAPHPADIAAFEPPANGEAVGEMPQTAEDRSAGRRRFEVIVGGWRFEAIVEPHARAELREKAARAAAEHAPQAASVLTAQIPGRVVRVWVSPGESVEQGQRLLAVEAMKMENEIRAPRAGVVRNLRVSLGALVERNAELLTIV